MTKMNNKTNQANVEHQIWPYILIAIVLLTFIVLAFVFCICKDCSRNQVYERDEFTKRKIEWYSLKARKRGESIYIKYNRDKYKYNHDEKVYAIKIGDVDGWGGIENFKEIFRGFYRDFFADPFMNTLFDFSHADVNVAPEDHGDRLALWFLD